MIAKKTGVSFRGYVNLTTEAQGLTAWKAAPWKKTKEERAQASEGSRGGMGAGGDGVPGLISSGSTDRSSGAARAEGITAGKGGTGRRKRAQNAA